MLMLVMSQGECKAVTLEERMLLEIHISSITLQLTTVKSHVLLSLSAMCIIQFTTQKVGVGSHTAISSSQAYSVDTFTFRNTVGIVSV